MPDIEAIWVISDVTPNGTYVATIQAGPDRAITLDRTQATAYVMAVLTAAVYAEYDAAVIRQHTALGLGLPTAAGAVKDMRADRAPLDDAATSPLRFESIVTAANRDPAVLVSLDGRRIAQWTAEETKGHALHVLEVVAVVDLDAAYYRYLRGPVRLDEGRARAVVGDLGQFRTGASDD